MSAVDPHAGQRVIHRGPPLARASHVVVAAHGRGSSPEDILGLADHLALPDVAWVAPAAAGGSWWPQSFLAPLDANEPGLSSALAAMDRAVAVVLAEGVAVERIAIMGFSQGACLALEYAARHPRPYGAVIGLSGGLVGSAEAAGPPSDALYGYAPKAFDYAGRLDGVAVALSVHERDPHIPLARTRESGVVFERLGATSTLTMHPGGGHGVMAADVTAMRGLLNAGEGTFPELGA